MHLPSVMDLHRAHLAATVQSSQSTVDLSTVVAENPVLRSLLHLLEVAGPVTGEYMGVIFPVLKMLLEPAQEPHKRSV